MGCGNCGSGASGKPGGCKGNGGCSTGGCNRLNVFDWLNGLPLHDSAKPYPVIEVSFNKGSRKDFYRNGSSNLLEKGEWIAVEGVGGFDVGQVSLTGELVKLQMKKYSVEDSSTLKRVMRPATEEDLQQYEKQKQREAEILIRSRAIARSFKLEMKLCEVEVQADGKKATFFYTADARVDFRELIKAYAGEFKVKVEMRQIGARQESGKVGGIGSCGRELCCSTWLTDFKSVNTTAARYQNLSINQTKLSGQCGRLKCCLNYELDTYMDALRVFPNDADTLQMAKGNAHLQKKDIFKNLMWYTFSDSSKQYPMSISRVKEIIQQNKQGIRPEELQAEELEVSSTKAGIKVDMGFVNDVGQVSLKALEKNNKKKKGNNKGGKGGGQQAAGDSRQRGDRPQGDRQARQQGGGNRPQGDRPARGPRPEGQQGGGNRPQGDRPQKQQGGGNNRPQGERPPRPEGQQGGNRPQGDRPPRAPRPEGQQGGGNRPQGDRPPKPPRPEGQQGRGNRPQGDRPQRPQGDRPPRPQNGNEQNSPPKPPTE